MSWWFRLSLLWAGVLAIAQLGWAAANQRGKDLYALCAACHGDYGQGNKKLDAPSIAGLPVWYLEAQLKNFRDGARGLHPRDNAGNKMRPMAKTLRKHGEQDDLPLVAAYVAELPAPSHTPTSSLEKADTSKGQQLYAVCVACHGVKAEGVEQMKAPALTHLDDWYLVTQLKNFKHGLRGADASKDPQGALMVPMAKILPDEQAMRDVTAYIKSLAGSK